MTLGDDLCRAFRGQLVDKLKINIVDPLRLGGVATHGGAHKISTGLGAEHSVLEIVAVSMSSWSGYFALMARMNWAEVEPSGRMAAVPCTARMSTPQATSSSTSFMVTVMYMGVPG